VLVDRDADELERAARSIDSPHVTWMAADVSKAADAKAYVDRCVADHGGVDILVANAGIEGKIAPLIDQTDEDFDRLMGVNLKGVWYGIKYAAPMIGQRGGGSIVLMSSVAGLIGSPGLGVYVASKHAVIGLMKTAAIELGPLGIRVNTINPGPIDTRMMRSLESQAAPGAPEAVKAAFTAQVPLGRYGTPQEIANMALFLASDEASYCNGWTYVADGGFVAQ
jgi:NAD(P)-dependent dehydrogenase (short-subunit alcohol dehydrogenase family)